MTSCALGDDELRTLYITTARQWLSDVELAREPLAGAVFAIRVPAGGIAEPVLSI